MVHVTAHAIERYQERVANVSDDEARQALSSPTIILAAKFGAAFVRLGTGQRVVIVDGAVITVRPVEDGRGQLRGHFGRAIPHHARHRYFRSND